MFRKPKEDHYVPQLLLRGFCDKKLGKDKLWFWNITDRQWEPRKIKDVCKEEGFYSLPGEAGVLSDSWFDEVILQYYENKFADIFSKKIKKGLSLSSRDIHFTFVFLLFMWIRTPSFRALTETDSTDWEKNILHMIAVLATEMESGKKYGWLKYKLMLLDIFPKLIFNGKGKPILFNRVTITVFDTDNSVRFVISDNPVLLYYDPDDKDKKIISFIVPLSKTQILMAGIRQDITNSSFSYARITPDLVKSINILIAKHKYVYLLSSGKGFLGDEILESI